ncbi:MAG: transcriptional regulator [Prevotella sp.]|nr:transcriptional regulator [Staphylococcus sp.]MCM1349674.1 transcriptional regulator [Prevotella sp.]
MNNNELVYKLIYLLKKKNHPLSEMHSFEQGENGILQTLYTYEQTKEKEITPSELSKIQQLSSGRIATTLKTLEKKQLIERTTDGVDKRRSIIQLTEKGRKMAEKIIKTTSQKLEHIIEKLGEQDALEFIRILKRLAE